ncbi:hypothetical protein [Treponema sp.]|uniref:hypothetical protein n=1 Tax=Treponema sp. TaxID=166 RepID=UPI003F103B5D
MENEKNKNVKKVTIILCSIVMVVSTMIFVPQIRELIMMFGDRISGKTIRQDILSEKLILWEVQFLCILAFILLSLLFENHFQSFAKIDTFIKNSIASWLFAVVFSAVLIAQAFQSNDVWLDETFSLGLARHSVKDLISLTAQDVHPPLYYLILKAGLLFNPNSVVLAKIVSVIPIIIIMCVSVVFFTKEFSSVYATVFNLLLVCTSGVFQYGVEIRMYSWAMLFCMLCCIFSYYIIKKGSFRYFLFYVISAVCGAYCHYWTAVTLAINFILTSILYFVKYKKVKNVIFSALIGIILYFPWISVVIKQVSAVTENYWIPLITLKTFISYIFTVIPVLGVAKIVMMFMVVVFFIKNVKYCIKKDESSLFSLICLLTPLLLIICATVISLVTRPVFISRYAVPTIVFMIFYITINLYSVKFLNKRLFFIFLLGISLFTINAVYNLKTEWNYSKKYNEFTETMKDNLSDNTVFVFSQNINSHIPICLAYLFPKNRICGFSIPKLWADVYFYNQENLIENCDEETDICLVLNIDETPPDDFLNCNCYLLNIPQYTANKFCFLKKQ